jgi:2-(1,2-epoxy-1,2-dihydrophenyl)acetyl-CoA isomerase
MGTVLLDIKENIAIIKLNRPEVLNAIDLEMRAKLEEVIEEVRRDREIRAVILTGEGRAFCAGGDVKSQREMTGAPVIAARERVKNIHRWMINLASMEKPVIAAVNGDAVGIGFSLALAADMIIASEQSRFSLIFSRIGLIPDAGGIFFLTRIVSLNKAKELVFTARMLDAAEAEKLGIVNRVVAHEELMSSAMELATRLANGPTQAYGLSKILLNKSSSVDFDTFLEMEALAQALTFQTDDYREGSKAFLEKRKPFFKGK